MITASSCARASVARSSALFSFGWWSAVPRLAQNLVDHRLVGVALRKALDQPVSLVFGAPRLDELGDLAVARDRQHDPVGLEDPCCELAL
jgi:hypothetical protein